METISSAIPERSFKKHLFEKVSSPEFIHGLPKLFSICHYIEFVARYRPIGQLFYSKEDDPRQMKFWRLKPFYWIKLCPYSSFHIIGGDDIEITLLHEAVHLYLYSIELPDRQFHDEILVESAAMLLQKNHPRTRLIFQELYPGLRFEPPFVGRYYLAKPVPV